MAADQFFRQYAVDSAHEESDRRIWERRVERMYLSVLVRLLNIHIFNILRL